jgi:hypothetical protein
MANEEELIRSAVHDAEQCKQLSEKVHETAKKYSSLISASGLVNIHIYIYEYSLSICLVMYMYLYLHI